LVHAIISVVLLVVLLSIWSPFYRFAFLVVVPSILVGFLLGKMSWRKEEERIDKRNGLILYFSDTHAYSALVFLFLLQTFKGSSRVIAAILDLSPWIFPVLIWLAAGIAVGHNAAYYYFVRKVEEQRGPLRVKRFYARSKVGAESMIGKQGTIMEKCQPNGTAKIENTIWTAESIDGTSIPAGEAVVVRDIEGLRVFVEPVDQG
jgi:membrane protein implicated in regulation of membrane protease activity